MQKGPTLAAAINIMVAQAAVAGVAGARGWRITACRTRITPSGTGAAVTAVSVCRCKGAAHCRMASHVSTEGALIGSRALSEHGKTTLLAEQ